MTETEESEADTAAIMRLVAEGVDALTRRDLEAYSNVWLHAPHVRRVANWSHGRDDWSEGGVCVHEGWDAIRSMWRHIFEETSLTVFPYGTHREDWNVRVGRDIAWATYKQYPLDGNSRPAPDITGFSHETRIFEKHSGEWKTVYMGFSFQLPRHPDEALVRVDERATIIAMSRRAAERIGKSATLRVRNGRLHAVNRDADTRLHAMIRDAACGAPWTGVVRVPFILKGEQGSVDCVCWIASSLDMNGNAVIAIGDQRASSRCLQDAALVYRLSPAQARLAKLIVEGHDLVAAAERLGVTVNTARTQLHRMFEKTGVRSQPALVTALLSVATPLA
ncbi:nuclear transport factor 2 family protein [Chelativorans salis]|uniref:Nuclear transport factor 2 family protein n=1 Tax=Chelativorans salis TaxID=2978478 RepID=A0ABT2LKX0_9HYPH|nr:nuclear transport factor 2 family protein [Chelativorans sp. EGI FJ00035]MCT7375024.1 nuclear transport factor 2 family protein [Chelativorans sp. EGI FJ00035]